MSDLALDLLNVVSPSPPSASPSYSAGRSGQETFDDCLCRAQTPTKPTSDEDRGPTIEQGEAAVTAPPPGDEANESQELDQRPSGADSEGGDVPAAKSEERDEQPAEEATADESVAVVATLATTIVDEADAVAEEAFAAEAGTAVDENAPRRPAPRAIVPAAGPKTAAETAELPPRPAQVISEPSIEPSIEPTAENEEGGQHLRPTPAAKPAVVTAVAAEPVAPAQQQPRTRPPAEATPSIATNGPAKASPRIESSESKPKSGGKQARQADAPTAANQPAAEPVAPIADAIIASSESGSAGQRGGHDANRAKLDLRTDAAASNAIQPAASTEPSAGDRPATTATTDVPLGGLETRMGQPLSTAQSAVGHGAPPGERTLTDVERARFVQRVARAFQTAGDGGTVRLRLSPPELGSVRLEVAVRDGVMHARLEAETPGTRTLLLESLPALRERLAQQDIRLERFDVDLMGQSPGGLPRQAGDDGGANERQSGGNGPARSPATAATAAAQSRQAIAADDGRLNVVI